MRNRSYAIVHIAKRRTPAAARDPRGLLDGAQGPIELGDNHLVGDGGHLWMGPGMDTEGMSGLNRTLGCLWERDHVGSYVWLDRSVIILCSFLLTKQGGRLVVGGKEIIQLRFSPCIICISRIQRPIIVCLSNLLASRLDTSCLTRPKSRGLSQYAMSSGR